MISGTKPDLSLLVDGFEGGTLRHCWRGGITDKDDHMLLVPASAGVGSAGCRTGRWCLQFKKCTGLGDAFSSIALTCTAATPCNVRYWFKGPVVQRFAAVGTYPQCPPGYVRANAEKDCNYTSVKVSAGDECCSAQWSEGKAAAFWAARCKDNGGDTVEYRDSKPYLCRMRRVAHTLAGKDPCPAGFSPSVATDCRSGDTVHGDACCSALWTPHQDQAYWEGACRGAGGDVVAHQTGKPSLCRMGSGWTTVEYVFVVASFAGSFIDKGTVAFRF